MAILTTGVPGDLPLGFRMRVHLLPGGVTFFDFDGVSPQSGQAHAFLEVICL